MGASANETASWEACIDGLYESVRTEDALTQALGRFRPFFDARSVTLLTTHGQAAEGLHIVACGVPPRAVMEYRSHFFKHDEWAKAVCARAGRQEGAAYRGSDLVPRRELMKSRFWKGFLVRYGFSDIATAVVEAQHEDTPGSFITFHRFAGQAPYPRSVVARLHALVPHLRRCLKLHRRLVPQLALGSAFDGLFREAGVPLLLLGADGNVIEANCSAKRTLDQIDSVLRKDSDGRLMYSSRQGWRALQPEIARLGERHHEADLPRIRLTALGATISLHIVQGALSDRLTVHRIAAICLVSVDAVAIAASRLRSTYGLTVVETHVATLLTEGRAVTEIAKELSCVPSTVRTHLQALFAKTGTHRQGELISVLMKSA